MHDIQSWYMTFQLQLLLQLRVALGHALLTVKMFLPWIDLTTQHAKYNVLKFLW